MLKSKNHEKSLVILSCLRRLCRAQDSEESHDARSFTVLLSRQRRVGRRLRMTGLLGIFYFIIQMAIPLKLFADADTKTLPLTFYIQPVTAVHAEGQTGSASVELGRILPGVDQQAEALNVTIRTNTEQRYKIFHRTVSNITSSQGGQMPEGGLRFMVSGGRAGGQSTVQGWTEVPDGRVEIFNSGTSGGADAFTVNYLVSGKKPLEAGDYFGQVRFEIEQN